MHSASAILESVFEDTTYKNARAVDENKKRCGLKKSSQLVSLKTLQKCNLTIKFNMKKSILIALIALLLGACSSSSNVGKHQNHLKSRPQNNFHHKDNGGCGWHNN